MQRERVSVFRKNAQLSECGAFHLSDGNLSDQWSTSDQQVCTVTSAVGRGTGRPVTSGRPVTNCSQHWTTSVRL